MWNWRRFAKISLIQRKTSHPSYHHKSIRYGGVESRLNITEQAWIQGELAYSNLDKNTYSTVDRKEVSRAWKLIGYADWDFATWTDQLRPKLTTNLDIRSMDADFVPVGASSSNRTRSRYETQYAKESFDDAFLLDTAGSPRGSQDERTMNFDIRMMPTDWLEVDAGVGRSEERAPESRQLSVIGDGVTPPLRRRSRAIRRFNRQPTTDNR